MLLRANALAKGFSGARVETVELLLALLDARARAVRARARLGRGERRPRPARASRAPARRRGRGAGRRRARCRARDALERVGLEPIALAAKEGLSLINGTQFMAAMAALGLVRARRLARRRGPRVRACRSRRCRARRRASSRAIHAARPLAGQATSAANVRLLLEGSAIIESHRWCDKVQDAYSLRCAPQVHGASRDLMEYVERTVAVELNAATDNPLVLVDGGARRLERELPRATARLRARRARDGGRRARLDLRAAARADGQPEPLRRAAAVPHHATAVSTRAS